MASDTQQQPGIDVALLERELNALWSDLGEGEPHNGVTRSCVLNLLIYAAAGKADYRLDETLIEVTGRHPSRAIVLIEDRESKKTLLDSWVTSRCTLPTSNSRQVCCEQITIKASTDRVREAPSAIASLVLADLPVYLWWRDAPRFGDALFERCASLSDRILVDSGAARSTGEGFHEIARFLDRSARHNPLMDLNWTRLSTWRSIVAGFYDVAEHRPYLDTVQQVKISYQASASADIAPRAVYLAAWLASRLDWNLVRAETKTESGFARFVFTSGSREVQIDLQSMLGQDENQGRLEEVVLTTGAGADAGAVFKVRKTSDGLRLAAEVTLGDIRRSERVLGYDRWTDSALLARELEVLGRDRVFEQSALLADRMIRSAMKV